MKADGCIRGEKAGLGRNKNRRVENRDDHWEDAIPRIPAWKSCKENLSANTWTPRDRLGFRPRHTREMTVDEIETEKRNK